MDASQSANLTNAINAATITAAVALAALIVNTIANFVLLKMRVTADHSLAKFKVEADVSLAERKFNLDRSMSAWHRRVELGEEVLGDVYKARSVFKQARRSVAFGGEGRSRPKAENSAEPAELELRKNAIYAPLERLNLHLDFLNSLSAKRWRFEAVFGSGGDDAFTAFIQAYNRVQFATSELLEDADRVRDGQQDLDQDSLKAFRSDLGWGPKRKDELGSSLDAAVQSIENIVRPAVALPASEK